MRVLAVSPMYYGPPWNEGVANLLRSYARYAADKCEHFIVVSAHSQLDAHLVHSERGSFGEEIIYVSSSRSINYQARLQLWYRIGQVTRSISKRCDVVLMLASASLFLGPRTVLLKTLTQCPLVLYVTGLTKPVLGLSWMVRVDKIAVGSPYLLRFFPEAQIVYPSLPTHLRPHRSIESKAQLDWQRGNAFKVLFLGALEKERGVEYLLRGVASARMTSSRPIKLILAWNGRGETNLLSIQQLIKELQIENIVDIRGHVNSTEAYSEADVLVIPRVAETRMSFPVRIVEALIMRKPLIVTQACDMGALVGSAGLCVPKCDAQALGSAISRLANDVKFYQSLVCNTEIMLSKYDVNESLSKLHHLLEAAAQ